MNIIDSAFYLGEAYGENRMVRVVFWFIGMELSLFMWSLELRRWEKEEQK